MTLTVKDQEHPFEFPADVLKYQLQIRSLNVNLRIAYKKDQVNNITSGEYWSLGQGEVFWDDNVETDKGLILYLATDTAGAIVELIYWTGIIRRS